MSRTSWNVNNFEIFNLLPKEISARIIQYLIEPQFNAIVEEIEVYTQKEEYSGVILSLRLESKIFMPNSEYESIYGIDECVQSTCVRHNINFVNTNKDMTVINEFIDCVKGDQEGVLIWKSPQYSSQHQNSLTYIPARTQNLKPKLISQVHQLSHEQYYPPSPMLLFTCDLKHGNYKCSDVTFNLSQKDKNMFIEAMLDIVKLVQEYA